KSSAGLPVRPVADTACKKIRDQQSPIGPSAAASYSRRPAEALPFAEVTLKRLDRRDRELVEKAQEGAARAYAPYSLFAVGAAVRSKSGAIYTAANLENASSGLTICAEAAALSLANSMGDPDIDAIAIVGFNFTRLAGA